MGTFFSLSSIDDDDEDTAAIVGCALVVVSWSCGMLRVQAELTPKLLCKGEKDRHTSIVQLRLSNACGLDLQVSTTSSMIPFDYFNL